MNTQLIELIAQKRKAGDRWAVEALSLVLLEVQKIEKVGGTITPLLMNNILKNRIDTTDGLMELKLAAKRNVSEEEHVLKLLRCLLLPELDRHELTKRVEEIIGDNRGARYIGQVRKVLVEDGVLFDGALLAEIVKG